MFSFVVWTMLSLPEAAVTVCLPVTLLEALLNALPALPNALPAALPALPNALPAALPNDLSALPNAILFQLSNVYFFCALTNCIYYKMFDHSLSNGYCLS